MLRYHKEVHNRSTRIQKFQCNLNTGRKISKTQIQNNCFLIAPNTPLSIDDTIKKMKTGAIESMLEFFKSHCNI